MSRQIEGCVPSTLKFAHGLDGDITELLAVLKTQPALAQTVAALDLDVHADVPERSMTDVLRCLPNLAYLRLTQCRRSDLAEALASGLAPMPNLRTFVLTLRSFGDTSSLFGWLALMPGLRVLTISGDCEGDPQLGEYFIDQARATGALRHVRVYEHDSNVQSLQLPLFVGPMPSLRSARITLRRRDADLLAELGDSQPVHLSLGCKPMFSGGSFWLPVDKLVSKSVLTGIHAWRHLRHLHIDYLSVGDSVFYVVRALGPRLLTLGIRCWSPSDYLVNKLAAHLVRCLGGPLPVLRTLSIEVSAQTNEGETLLRTRVHPVCRRRRVRFLVSTLRP